MILVAAMAAALWGIGWAMGIPRQARWNMVALLIVAVLALHIMLPEGHPVRVNTGGSAAFWVFLIAVGVLIRAYGYLLAAIRKNIPSEPNGPSEDEGPFSETELDRYARHILLREIGGPGQFALKQARVLVVGAGGLGAPVLQYLAAAGVGTIGVIDDDVVENSNLQRQVIHRDAAIGQPKVKSAADAMAAQNPFVTVKPYARRLTDDIAADLVAEYDLVLDGSDNFATRYLVNAACAQAGVPLIAAAMTQWEGQISLYHPAQGAPCFQCVFPQAPEPGLVPNCSEGGVVGPLPGVMGAMMAVEAVKALTGAGETLAGRLLIYDALYAETRMITVKRRADCGCCG